MTETRPVHPWVAEGTRRIRFGVVGNFLAGWPDHLRFATEAERIGYESVSLFDHPNRLMECWTLMAALAASTERIRLMSMVSCVYYRSPFMLARQAADVDRISGGGPGFGVGIGGGRARVAELGLAVGRAFGVAMGDDVPEFAELGLPFERTGTRQRAMEDTVRVVQALWRGEHVTGPDGTGGQPAGGRRGDRAGP